MAYDFVILRQAGSAGPDSFTSAGFGTPAGAMVTVTRALTNATAKDGNVFCIGVTDFTTSHCISAASQHGADISVSTRHTHTTRFVYMTDGDNTVIAEGTVATTTNGITITWSTAPAEAYLITVKMWNADWSVHVGNQLVGNANANSVYTGASFEAEMGVFLYTSALAAGTPSTRTSAQIAMGFADNGASITQLGCSVAMLNGKDTTDNRAEIWANRVLGTHGGNAKIELTAFSATGLTLVARLGNANTYVPFMLLSSNGNKGHALYTVNPPATRPNDVAVTGLGFTPDATLAISTAMTAYATQVTSPPGSNSFSFGAADGTSQFCNSLSDQDGAATTNTQSYVDTKLMHSPAHNGRK